MPPRQFSQRGRLSVAGPYAALVALYTTCSQYAHTDWCTKSFGPSVYVPDTHSWSVLSPLPFCKASCCSFFGKALSLAGWFGRSQCNEGYYFNSSYFDYEFGTGVEGVSSWQYYNASAETCGDTPTDSKPFTFGAQCLPRQINRAATISGGSNYAEALQRLQSNLAPFPDDAFAGQAPVLCTSSQTPVPEWIFVLGGLGIVAGLGIYGRKILIAMGVKMTKITPSRGFAIDISAAFVVVVGSRCRSATTTTHTHRARNLDLRIPH